MECILVDFYMKSHDVIFDARSIWTQKPRDNAQNLEAQPGGFEHCVLYKIGRGYLRYE